MVCKEPSFRDFTGEVIRVKIHVLHGSKSINTVACLDNDYPTNMVDLSIEAQGARMKALYIREKEIKDSRKTRMLDEIPDPPNIKFMCKKRKETTKKMPSKVLEVVPPLDPGNTENIARIILYIERDYISPLLGEAMVLFKGQLAKVMKGGCKINGKEYKALIRFSYKLSMNLGDIYNIKGEFHETTDNALKAMFEKLNRLYYKPPPVHPVPKALGEEEQEQEQEQDSEGDSEGDSGSEEQEQGQEQGSEVGSDRDTQLFGESDTESESDSDSGGIWSTKKDVCTGFGLYKYLF